MFKKILVAYDGSDHAARAFEVAVDLATKLSSKLEIVQVEPHPTTPNRVTEIGRSGNDELSKVAAQVLTPLWAKARSHGVKDVSGDVLYGEPAHEIARYAKDNDVDLVVMGRRGRGRIDGLVLGSVSSHLTSHANCAVLTVK